MFIKGKPIRFGYKIWPLCGNDGYPYHLKIYQGRERNAAGQNKPLGTRVVKSMVEIITASSSVEKHDLYFDNFFTSYKLFNDLSEISVRSKGTIRENRTGEAKNVLISKKELQKKNVEILIIAAMERSMLQRGMTIRL